MTAALEDDALAIEEVSLSLADGGTVGVSGRIELGDGWKINEADLSMVANAIDVNKFHAIWPNGWLAGRETGSETRSLKLRLRMCVCGS